MTTRTFLFSWLILACLTGSLVAQDADPEAPVEQEEKPGEKPDGAAEEEEAKEPDPNPALAEFEAGYPEIQRLLRVIEHVRQNYVEEDRVSYDELIDSALEGMLASLDPHSQYIHPKAFSQMKKTQGTNTYDGVGITVSKKNGALVIVSVREDGPAAREGILPGDQILQVGDTQASKVPIDEILRLLRGRPGEKLVLTVRRPATNELLEVEMLREVMKQDTVRDSMLLDVAMTGDDKIGYIRLLQFNAPSSRELRMALDKLEDAGMEAFVFDLRNNPGGLLSTAIKVCGEFLPPNTSVVTTEGRSELASQNPPAYRTPERQYRSRTYPMAVLVNHSSASASEIVAGALQDLNRAVIVGETTFGKGSVQTIVPMGGGAAVKLTTAKYYTPSKKTIHENGVVPNIVATLTPAEEKRIFEWRRKSVQNKTTGKQLAELGDRQLERAVVALKGVLVFNQKTSAEKP